MARPDMSRIAPFFHNYINQAPQGDVLSAIRELGSECVSLMQSIPTEKHDHAYAPGKWTLKEVFQHIIDTERVMAYRALCFARKEAQNLPGFDENDYAEHSKAASRKWNDMLEEFTTVRKSSEQFFATLDKDQLESGGTANNKPMYVLALGYIIAGHCQHHLNIIRERYLKAG
jgi:hypothetical protein